MILKNKHKVRNISVGGDANYDFHRNIGNVETRESGVNQMKQAKRTIQIKNHVEEIIKNGKIVVIDEYPDFEMIDKCIQCGIMVNERIISNESCTTSNDNLVFLKWNGTCLCMTCVQEYEKLSSN